MPWSCAWSSYHIWVFSFLCILLDRSIFCYWCTQVFYICHRTFSDAVRPKRAYAHSCNPWCQSVESCDNVSKRSRANTLMMLLQCFSNISDSILYGRCCCFLWSVFNTAPGTVASKGCCWATKAHQDLRHAVWCLQWCLGYGRGWQIHRGEVTRHYNTSCVFSCKKNTVVELTKSRIYTFGDLECWSLMLKP